MCWWAARRLPGEPQRCLPSAKLPAHLWTSRSRDGLNEDLETILTMRINKLKTFADAFGQDLCVSHKLTTKMQKSATSHRPRAQKTSRHQVLEHPERSSLGSHVSSLRIKTHKLIIWQKQGHRSRRRPCIALVLVLVLVLVLALVLPLVPALALALARVASTRASAG